MDQFIIDNYYRDHPKNPFPNYESIDQNSIDQILTEVKANLHLPQNVTAMDVVKVIRAQSTSLVEWNTEAEDFNLTAIIRCVNINPLDDIYINWQLFSNVDKMKLCDLEKYFHDIWYIGPYDIEIFDDTLSWFLGIDHGGDISFYIP